MKEIEKISVIVPVYNVEAYLPRCLDSILSQSYSNLEVILVDDGSPDHSGEICEEYAGRDERIRVIHQKNQGVSAARNAGLAVATGEWIGFVDGDDWVDSEMYEYLYSIAKIYDSNLVQCGIRCEQADYEEIIYAPIKEQRIVLMENISKDILGEYFANSVCCRLFNKKVILGLSFNPEFPIGEDALFSLSALARCMETVLGNEVYYHYRQNPRSAIHTVVKENRLNSAREMFQYAEKSFSQQKSIVQFCQNSRLRNNLDICSKIVCNHIEKEHISLVKEIRNEMRVLCKTHFAGTNFNNSNFAGAEHP